MRKPPMEGVRALVVDDERRIASICARVLRGLGAEVDMAGTCAEAAALIRGGRHDLLVCDLKLPDGDGLAVAALFRELRPEGRVVIATGSLLTESARRAAAADAHGIVFKPFGLEDFKKAVIKTLGVASLFVAGLLGAGRASAADVHAVLSADTRLYHEAWDGFRETFGPEAALTVLDDAGAADAPKDARVVVAFGAKAALRRVPSGARLIVVMAPSIGERDGIKPGFIRVCMSPDAPELLSRMTKVQPGLRRLGLVWKSSLYGREFLPRLEAAARARGVEIVAAEVLSDDALPDVLRSLYGRVDALWLPPDPLLISQRSFMLLRDFSQANRVPLYAPTAGLAEQGAAASIGVSFREVGRAAGRAARRALASEELAPLNFPSPAETVLNRAAAAKSGLSVDASALKAADRVIP